MAKKKRVQSPATNPPIHEQPAHPPPDNPELRHSAEENDLKNSRQMALQRIKALEQMKRAERGEDPA